MFRVRINGHISYKYLLLAGILIAAVGFYGVTQVTWRQTRLAAAQRAPPYSYTTQTSRRTQPAQPETTRRLRRDSCDGCFRYQYRSLINPRRVCDGKSDKVTLVILITTIPKSVEARRSIRRTWARFTKNNTGSVRYVFLFGAFWADDQKIIDDESARYDDILQDDFIDVYRHLSVKVLMGFRWVLANCPEARFIMRAADDTYVNIPGVIHLLQEHEAMFTNKMAGHCISVSTPVRSEGHKWHVPFASYPEDTYPPYCIGTTFLQTLRLTRDLVEKSKDVPFFEVEDVYFGLVMQQINATLLNIVGFDVQWSYARYHRADHWYTLHDITPTHMLYIWYIEAKRHQVYREFFDHSEGKPNLQF